LGVDAFLGGELARRTGLKAPALMKDEPRAGVTVRGLLLEKGSEINGGLILHDAHSPHVAVDQWREPSVWVTIVAAVVVHVPSRRACSALRNAASALACSSVAPTLLAATSMFFMPES
jgi:hypothetical protein